MNGGIEIATNTNPVLSVVSCLRKMAASYLIFCRLVLFYISLNWCIALPHPSNRFKRDLDDDAIIAALQMYESQMSRIESRIAQQQDVMKNQRRRINAMKYYLKAKADEYVKDDLEGLINSMTDEARQLLKLASLDNLVVTIDHHEKRQQDLHKALKKDNVVMDDIRQRILNNKVICRDARTDWKDRAGANIRELARHFVKCSENELLQEFVLKRDGGSFSSKVRYEYKCCHLSVKDNWQRPDDI